MRRRNFRGLPPEAAGWMEGRRRAEEFACYLRGVLGCDADDVRPLDYHAEGFHGFPPGSYGAEVVGTEADISARLPAGLSVVAVYDDDEDPPLVEVQEEWPKHLERAWARLNPRGGW